MGTIFLPTLQIKKQDSDIKHCGSKWSVGLTMFKSYMNIGWGSGLTHPWCVQGLNAGLEIKSSSSSGSGRGCVYLLQICLLVRGERQTCIACRGHLPDAIHRGNPSRMLSQTLGTWHQARRRGIFLSTVLKWDRDGLFLPGNIHPITDL